MRWKKTTNFLTSLFGQSQHLLVRGVQPELGRWQGVFLAEFDGPRVGPDSPELHCEACAHEWRGAPR